MAARLHDWLIETWYGGGQRGRWLAPAAWIYGAFVRLRRASYRLGWRRTHRALRPVVVVGNLTVGGTGKTPFVAWLARELERKGLRAGIALRGYGAAPSPARLVGAEEAETSGDEAAMLRRQLPVPIAVGARRAEAARLLESVCDIILCDDGLQHYALARDFEIAIVDGARGFGNGRLLPAGPLREPASRLEAVDAVVVNGPGFERPAAIRMRVEPVAVVSLESGARVPLAQFAGRRAIGTAAIGNPERFFDLLRAHGIEVVERPFPDHERIDRARLEPRRGLPILMTEKDAVKCAGPGWNDTWYVEVEARVDAADAASLVERIVNHPDRRGIRERE